MAERSIFAGDLLQQLEIVFVKMLFVYFLILVDTVFPQMRFHYSLGLHGVDILLRGL